MIHMMVSAPNYGKGSNVMTAPQPCGCSSERKLALDAPVAKALIHSFNPINLFNLLKTVPKLCQNYAKTMPKLCRFCARFLCRFCVLYVPEFSNFGKVGTIVAGPNSVAITGGASVGTTDPWANLSY
jgi:hypothetical protein